MAIKFIPATEKVKTESLIAVIYGEPGIGKTSVASTTEQSILIDFDMGLQRTVKRAMAVRVETWNDVVQLQQSNEFLDYKPKTLIIDTAGTMLDNYIGVHVIEENPKNSTKGGAISLTGYGAMKAVFNQFKNWASSLNINLVFVCHDANEMDGDDNKKKPKMTGGSYQILRESADLIGYMYMKGKNRVIDFTPADWKVGKDCASIGSVVVPDASAHFSKA